MIRPSRVTTVAMIASATVIAFSAGFLLAGYPLLPWLLPVHFKSNGYPNGWQYKTYLRVLMPVFVQLTLAFTLFAIGALLLSRPHGAHDEDAADVQAATAAAEAVALLAFIWIAFQGYAAVALAEMWQRQRAGLGAYAPLEIAGLALSLGVTIRAHLRLGRPLPRPFVPEHWRFGQLYRNPNDPALFVPTRNGARWTLNFGRPVAAALMGVVLVVGILVPALILGLSLR
jgi:uncharacterized membrane protein